MQKLSFVLIALMVSVFTVADCPQAAMIGFNPISQVIDIGTTVEADLAVAGLGNFVAPSVGSFDVDIRYDTTVLMFTDYRLGPYLGDTGLFEASDASAGEASPGLINIAELSLLDANSTSGPTFMSPYLEEIQPDAFTLVTLSFDAVAVGASSLMIERSLLGDALGQPIDHNVQDGGITVTPLPSAMLLLGTGLGVVAVFRKKFIRS